MSQPPPPRYKIVERDGRLITIDTWAKKGPPAPNVPPPLTPRTDFAAAGGGFGEMLVASLLTVRDEQGRRLLTTSPNWDRKGPRIIALSARGERRIGAVLVTLCILALLVIAAAIIDLDLLLPLVVIAIVVAGALSSSRAAPVTRFLDGLG